MDGAGNDPELVGRSFFAHRLDGLLDAFMRQLEQVGEIIAGEAGFRKTDNAAAFARSQSQIMDAAFKVVFQRASPVELHAGNL